MGGRGQPGLAEHLGQLLEEDLELLIRQRPHGECTRVGALLMQPAPKEPLRACQRVSDASESGGGSNPMPW